MSVNDQDIQNLFQEKLAGHESAVKPELWSGVQSGLNSGLAASSAGAAGLSVAKIIFIAAALVGVTVMSVVLWPEEKEIIIPENTELNPIETEKLQESNEVVEIQALSSDTQSEFTEEPIAEKESQKESTPEKSTTENPVQLKSAPLTTVPLVSSSKVETAQVDENSELEEVVSEIVTEEETFVKAKVSIYADQNSALDIHFSVVGDITELSWDFGDGTSSTSAQGTHTYSEQGEYAVVASWLDHSGERKEKVLEAKVYELPALVLPNVFTPGTSPGLNDYYDIDAASSKNVEGYSIKIYSQDGEILFESNESTRVWDGKDRFGNPMPQGYYLAIVEAWNVLNKRSIKRQSIYLKRD